MDKKRDRDNKKRRTKSITRKLNPEQWLICCEGRSELLYLSALVNELAKGRRHGIHFGNAKSCKPIGDMRGECGRQNISLYDKAQQCAAQGLFSRVWIVFDLDAVGEAEKNQKENFSRAIKLCQSNALISAAWSIPKFEYFLFLHSGSQIEALSDTAYSKKIHELGEKFIADENLCLQRCQTSCRKSNACKKVLEKPYYNGFYALGGLAGARAASKLSKKSFEENIEDIEHCNFRKVTSCSSMHQLIQELIEYFEEL